MVYILQYHLFRKADFPGDVNITLRSSEILVHETHFPGRKKHEKLQNRPGRSYGTSAVPSCNPPWRSPFVPRTWLANSWDLLHFQVLHVILRTFSDRQRSPGSGILFIEGGFSAFHVGGSERKITMESLSIWLLFVGFCRLSAVYFGFFNVWALRVAVFSKLKTSKRTELSYSRIECELYPSIYFHHFHKSVVGIRSNAEY